MRSPDPRSSDGEDPDDIGDDFAGESPDDAYEAPEPDALDAFAGEAGIDLSDASELDADNVPADEESHRVVQAPD